MLRFDVLTLFPAFFDGVLGDSILGRAQNAGHIKVRVLNLRDWSRDEKHSKVDDRPYGGGPGMVLKPEPVVEAVDAMRSEGPCHVVLTSPAGRRFDQTVARELAAEERIVIICGHYEGYDERIRTIIRPDEISIGDYVLTGGELAAMVMVDAVSRLIPGVLGDPASSVEDSFTDGLLDHPHYTRPEVFRDLKVPEVLLSGDHARIAEWRKQMAEARTSGRRPDLFELYRASHPLPKKKRRRTHAPEGEPEGEQRSEP
jgi:tRNA (guanine37-N1)-methyltransferase